MGDWAQRSNAIVQDAESRDRESRVVEATLQLLVYFEGLDSPCVRLPVATKFCRLTLVFLASGNVNLIHLCGLPTSHELL